MTKREFCLDFDRENALAQLTGTTRGTRVLTSSLTRGLAFLSPCFAPVVLNWLEHGEW